ncbi:MULTISPECIES: phytoene/squalene synthase family protein [Croceibacter]|jgi:phytoene synthase|uniref:phytoene/squalene synthase family protein n=1 Tax=Croceibacter TaxID=216431 RepID=UPI000C6A5A2A|nr:MULTISPECIES: phytoene/squalene synthase family protein [Croceibacter]MAM23476.1 phytoene synthase [Croceibacter sp.]MBG24562.1 phytoene synthase [Croceibacter sp.]WSP34883.1 phytoene/squalene synthase family protein [Croceibacter atlanticus]|tara:strand:- start:1846 stop:2685 length:840 start_codon:yes stop_codon:yes gene_type:complete
MKSIFDTVSRDCSKAVTNSYSTSFSLASKLLAPSIRQDVYNVYGFVRFADEIVDSFHNYDKETLLNDFEEDLKKAVRDKISLNPILNSFQETVHKFNIEEEFYMSFLRSMRLDLYKSKYLTKEEYEDYIYGSADVVGLMCLKVFVKGDQQKFDDLKEDAMKLGSAFQKVNFLRDLKADLEDLNRSYFPNTNLQKLDENSKKRIIEEIELDFKAGLKGIQRLPVEAKLGVYTAYVYYLRLLHKLKKTPSLEIRNKRIRVPNYEKAGLMAKSYVTCRLNLL